MIHSLQKRGHEKGELISVAMEIAGEAKNYILYVYICTLCWVYAERTIVFKRSFLCVHPAFHACKLMRGPKVSSERNEPFKRINSLSALS